jgi:hypothetical protein
MYRPLFVITMIVTALGAAGTIYWIARDPSNRDGGYYFVGTLLLLTVLFGSGAISEY